MFLSTTLGAGLRVTVAGLYEEGDNDIIIAGATGSFDSESTTFEGRVDKRINRGQHWIEPVVSIRYVDADQDNYIDSTGTLVTGQDQMAEGSPPLDAFNILINIIISINDVKHPTVYPTRSHCFSVICDRICQS